MFSSFCIFSYLIETFDAERSEFFRQNFTSSNLFHFTLCSQKSLRTKYICIYLESLAKVKYLTTLFAYNLTMPIFLNTKLVYNPF